MDGPVVPHKREHKVADLYGTVRVVERGDGYFFIEQPRDDEDPFDETFERIAISRETMEKLHAKIGEWLSK